MEKVKSVDEFFNKIKLWKAELSLLRSSLLLTELKEELKWGIPTYTVDGKNVVSISGYKNHFALWFFQGALLKDTSKVLINAQEGKTKAQRQWRFKSVEDIDVDLLSAYVIEAIRNQREGKEIPINRSGVFLIPSKLKDELNKDAVLLKNFNLLTKGKQKEYCTYISEAKKESTQNKRILKIIPMINNLIGLNDKYKKK